MGSDRRAVPTSVPAVVMAAGGLGLGEVGNRDDGKSRDAQGSKTPLTPVGLEILSGVLWRCQLGDFASRVDTEQKLPSAGPWDPRPPTPEAHQGLKVFQSLIHQPLLYR